MAPPIRAARSVSLACPSSLPASSLSASRILPASSCSSYHRLRGLADLRLQHIVITIVFFPHHDGEAAVQVSRLDIDARSTVGPVKDAMGRQHAPDEEFFFALLGLTQEVRLALCVARKSGAYMSLSLFHYSAASVGCRSIMKWLSTTLLLSSDCMWPSLCSRPYPTSPTFIFLLRLARTPTVGRPHVLRHERRREHIIWMLK
ncbi:hypothetical protein K469DRAFT_362121 [Zopfia rhizophila CBS 207.26]|uniref:Uncharacterized protein n=1 Tax=Zopfia rhizophila CBS 207.26 TaxID=1314779 RepID=A0A6A6EJW5_9PEZI|nr:hypothetical protein K469DRAFT_362121 [Zopfia rhizophila CBS 207.26]